MKHPLGQTQNGIEVYVDLIKSHAARHIAEQPHLLGLTTEVIKHLSPRGPEVVVERDMKRSIGYDFIVESTDKDTIFYAQITKDNKVTRFVKNGKPTSTQYLTIILRRDTEDNTYELHDAWIGRIKPAQSGSTDETTESKLYWEDHAVVYANQTLQTHTISKSLPGQDVLVA